VKDFYDENNKTLKKIPEDGKIHTPLHVHGLAEYCENGYIT
jgi:hypothetical protein